MPLGVFLYELDGSLTPKVIDDFYLEEIKVSLEILKTLADMHVNKAFHEVMHGEGDLNYFSKELDGRSVGVKHLCLGFILKEDEDLISLRSIIESKEKIILQKYSKDEKKVKNVLKGMIDSILSLLEKLKEPELIKAKINKTAKGLLDEGHSAEAMELIELGNKIPEKLAEEIKLGEELFQTKEYKKAGKRFSKAADFASKIKDEEIASFLKRKAQMYNEYPTFIKESDLLHSEIMKISNQLKHGRVLLYQNLITKIDNLINLLSKFEKVELIEPLIKLKVDTYGAFEIAEKLKEIELKLKEQIDKVKL